MNGLIVLAVVWLLLWAVWRLSVWVCPFLPALVRAGWRTLVRLVWTAPVRRWGIAKTIWLWLLVVAVVVSVTAARGQRQAVRAVAMLWVLVAISWFIMRWWADRRYRARPLPTRRVRR